MTLNYMFCKVHYENVTVRMEMLSPQAVLHQQLEFKLIEDREETGVILEVRASAFVSI